MSGWHGLHELPYPGDAAPWFEMLADKPWAAFLDSGRPFGGCGRYDILCADPYMTVVTRGHMTEIRTCRNVILTPDDSFRVLAKLLRPSPIVSPQIPFAGGAVGYFGYDLGRRIESLPVMAQDGEHIPTMAVGLYDWAVVVDHEARRAWLAGQGNHAETRLLWPDLVERFRDIPAMRTRSGFRLLGPLISNMTRADYARRFGHIQHYIREGDCYQVNLAQRFSAPADGDPWGAYRALRQSSAAPFGAYLQTPFANILSNSPERFLAVRDGRVETRPIKGTRPRSPDPESDRKLADELINSPKDRAENLMIVDLIRNDLGKSAELGSVEVNELFSLESYATVHHLVSTITARLPPGRSPLELLRDCFPGGSITGAPKLRAMEIIEELEPHRRGVYCGAIGYVGSDGRMDTNIAIRTLVHGGGEVRFWAGGGIVADSRVDEEYQETLDKAAAMLRLLECTELSHVGG
ncbi:MAG: aminodeoxychorismate synthase component I [Thioalkalivibrio sp.]